MNRPVGGDGGVCGGVPGEIGLVLGGLAVCPGFVLIEEVDAVADGRVGGAHEDVEETGSRDAEIGVLQADETGGGGVVVNEYLQAEAVGFMFEMAAVGKSDGRENQRNNAQKQHDQGEGSDVRELVEAEALAGARRSQVAAR